MTDLPLTAEQALAIVAAVLGNPVRSSAYGLAGERNPSPYACVDDNIRRVHMHVPSDTENNAILDLAKSVSGHYPIEFNEAAKDLI